VLGGKSGSDQLRTWATRELKGYYGEDALPDYREVPAPIRIDGATAHGLITGQQIGRSSLPDFVQENVRESVELREGVGAIEALAKNGESNGDVVKMSLPMGGDIARLMSADRHGQTIMSVYWAVAPVALRGVLDQIRTALTLLVAELRASVPSGHDLPSAAAADHAVQFVVTGKRNQITVNTAQAAEGASASVTVSPPTEQGASSWSRSRRIGAVVVGTATIVGAVAAVIAIVH
jgi:hypothetical protein